MCNGISPVEDQVKAPEENNKLKHSGLPSDLKIGELFTTFCGIVNPVEGNYRGVWLDELPSCPECELKARSIRGY